METSPWLQVFGRLHPVLLHVPIGALVALVALELLARRGDARNAARGILVALVAVSAVLSAGSGWLLGEELGQAGSAFLWHRGLGIAFAALTTAAAVAAVRRKPRTYGVLLSLAAAVLVPSAHLGATMTHGEGYLLLAPSSPGDAGLAASDRTWFGSRIAPILTARCAACHGPRKQKGGLALHEPARILRGGESGPVLVPGNAPASEIVRRLSLPLDHEDHMPPEGKPQPTALEIGEIEAWIAAGASFEAPPPPGARPIALADRAGPAAAVPTPPPADALAALAGTPVHVELVDPDARLLWIDFGPRPETDDGFAREHLAALRDFVVELSLAGTAVGDRVLELVATMPKLERLDLSRTRCSSEGIAHLAGHAALRSLNLTSTAVDDRAVSALASLPSLERLHVWGSGLTPEGLGALAPLVPSSLESRPLETEPPLTPAPSLAPINATCPVTDRPVDTAFRIVFREEVVAFCCGECPAAFWKDPAAYAR